MGNESMDQALSQVSERTNHAAVFYIIHIPTPAARYDSPTAYEEP